MATDIQTVAKFYATAQGAVALRSVRERLALMWPDLAGQSVSGLGYVVPYLRAWRKEAGRCISAMPSGAVKWPGDGPNLSCAVQEDKLPFTGLSLDRVVLVHGLENARRTLREVWRVLKDDGHLLVVAPNRVGPWAHVESTPFGQGQAYSPAAGGQPIPD